MKGEKGKSDRSNCFKLLGVSPMNMGIAKLCGLVGKLFQGHCLLPWTGRLCNSEIHGYPQLTQWDQSMAKSDFTDRQCLG